MIFKNKDHIICDFDGTIVDSLEMWANVDAILLRKLGKSPRSTLHRERVDFLHSEHGKNLYVLYNQYLIDTYGITGIDAEEFGERRLEEIKTLQKTMDLKPGAEEFLRTAKSKGYYLTLATLTERELLEYYAKFNENIKRKTDGFELFSTIISKDDVRKQKPSPDAYLKALRLSRHSIEESVAIEDSLTGTMAAKAAKLCTISIYDRFSDDDREKINELVDYQARDFHELIKVL